MMPPDFPAAGPGPKAIVARGYDAVGRRYAELAERSAAGVRQKYEAVLLDALPPGSRVLDLGCGAGVPTTRRLAERFAVTGIDISERQVRRARRNVPDATFVRADMAQAAFHNDSFDAVAAFYSVMHLPREEQAAMLARASSWLRPGGLLVATLGVEPVEAAYEKVWLGVTMFWSSFDGPTGTSLVEGAGLGIVSAREETTRTEDGRETFLWVVARKPQAGAS